MQGFHKSADLRASAKISRNGWSFPIDRTLESKRPGRQRVAVSLPVPVMAGAREVGFAVLLVFSRMLGETELSVRLLREKKSPTHIAGEVFDGATIQQAFASCKIVANPTAPEIHFAILEATAPHDEGYPKLSFSNEASDLNLSLSFDPSQLTIVSARDLLEKIGIILNAISTMPEKRCGDLELVSSTARGLISDFSKQIQFHRPEFVPETFFDVVSKYPHAPAVSNGTQSYTYDRLSRLVRYLTLRLTEAGIQEGDIVALSGFASLGMFASMLAVMASGGVFVTVDLALPEERQQLIETISQPRLRIDIRGPGETASEGVTIVTTDWPSLDEIDALPDHLFRVIELNHDAAAYVFFTSGSTGVPKGVLGTHSGLGHFLDWERTNFPIGPGDRVAQLTALSFDPVLRDIFLPLTSGACLQVPRRDLLLDARRILRWFSDTAITLTHCVPSLMKAWLQADIEGRPFASLRFILFAGEPLTDTLLKRFAEAAGHDTLIVNLYGPTETTLAKLANRIERIEAGVQPVGYPQRGADVAIIRNRRTRCGLWEVGEIAIRTPYRSKGYLRNPTLTAEFFRPNSERNDHGDLVYYTGDLGRARPDGKIEIFGRTDAQIKIRGVRIEPNEVEGRMLELPGVKDAAVTVRVAANEDKVLLGLVVPQQPLGEAEQATFQHSVREALKGRLSDAMVPARIVLCGALPYLPNGKLDRKAIAALEIEARAENSPSLRHAAHLEDTMRRFVGDIEDALDTRIDNLERSFLDLGGDSLSYIRASIIIEDLLGWLPQNWETKPISEIQKLWTNQGIATSRSRWTGIEATVLFRAVSIILMVMSHTKGLEFVTATSTLFVISGMNFSRFVRPAIRSSGNLRPLTSLILKFAVPAALWQALRSWWMGSWWIPNLLLLGTFFQNPAKPLYTLWYLDVLAANLVVLAVISWVGYRVRIFRGEAASSGDTYKVDFLWVMIGLVVAAAQVLSGWWDGQVGTDSVAPFKWFWMLALGVLITVSDTPLRKWAVTALLVGLVAAAHSRMPQLIGIDDFFFVAIGLMLWIERLPMPRFLHRPIVVIASSTLFIYILNYTIITHILPKLHVPAWASIEIAVAVICGIVAHAAWNFFVGILTRIVNGRRTEESSGPSLLLRPMMDESRRDI